MEHAKPPLPGRFLEYRLSIEVESSPERAIDTLKHINTYHEWTDLLKLSGQEPLLVGAEIQVKISQRQKEERFTAQVVLVEPFRFAARQLILAPWFFQAIHFFEITPKDPDRVIFTQRWELRGLLSKIFKRKIFETLSGFEQMNVDFKNHLESHLIPS